MEPQMALPEEAAYGMQKETVPRNWRAAHP